jgi:hypothetical protein
VVCLLLNHSNKTVFANAYKKVFFQLLISVDKLAKKAKPQAKQINKKYQFDIRAHRKINLLDNDSSSEDDDVNNAYKRNRKQLKPNDSRKLTQNNDRCKFVTLTKIDLSDDRKTPKIKRDLSTKSLGENTKADSSMPPRKSVPRNKIRVCKELNKTSATSGSSSKNSKQSYLISNQIKPKSNFILTKI